jgi:hypothetical protein
MDNASATCSARASEQQVFGDRSELSRTPACFYRWKHSPNHLFALPTLRKPALVNQGVRMNGCRSCSKAGVLRRIFCSELVLHLRCTKSQARGETGMRNVQMKTGITEKKKKKKKNKKKT